MGIDEGEIQVDVGDQGKPAAMVERHDLPMSLGRLRAILNSLDDGGEGIRDPDKVASSAAAGLDLAVAAKQSPEVYVRAVKTACDSLKEKYPKLFEKQTVRIALVTKLFEGLVVNAPVKSAATDTALENNNSLGVYTDAIGYPGVKKVFILLKEGVINEAEFSVLIKILYPDLPEFFSYRAETSITDYMFLQNYPKNNIKDGQGADWIPEFKNQPALFLNNYPWAPPVVGTRPGGEYTTIGAVKKQIVEKGPDFLRSMGMDPSKYELRLAGIADLFRAPAAIHYGEIPQWFVLDEEIHSSADDPDPTKIDAICAGNLVKGGPGRFAPADIGMDISIDSFANSQFKFQLVISPRISRV